MASEDTGTPHVNGIETIEVSQSDPRDPPPFTSGVGRRKLVKLLFPVKFKPDSSLPLPGRKVVLLSNSATAIPVIPSPHPLPTPPTATPPTPTTSSAVETTNGAQISKSASSAKPNEIDGVVKRKKAVDVAAMQPAGKRDLRSRPMGGDKKKTSCASEESQRGLATVRPPTVTNGRLPVSPREKGSHRGVSPELNAKQGQQTLGILDQSPHSLQPSNPSSDPPPEPITVGPVIDPALLPPLFSAATDLVLRDLARHFPADLRNRWLSGVVHEFVGEYYGRVPQNSGLGLSSIPPLSGAWQHARNPSTPAVQPTSSVVPLSLPPPRREVRRRVSWAMPKLVANSGQQLREKAESKPDPETESLDDKTLELSLTPLTEETSVLPQNGTETDDNTLVRAPSDDIPANLEPHQSPDSRMSDRSQSRERLNPPRTPPRTSPSRGADDNPTGAAALVLSTKQPGKLPSFKKSRTLAGKHQFVEASPSKTHRSMIANGRGPNLNSPANQGDDSVSDSDSENGEGSNLRKTKKPTRMKVKRGRQPIGREDSEESEDARPPRKLQKSQSHGQDVEDDDDDLAEFFGAGVRERRTVMDSDSDEEKMHIDETDPPVSEDRSVEDVQLEVRAKDEMELDQTSSLEESLPTPTVDSTKLGYISSSPSLLSAPQLPLVPLPVTTFPVPTPTPVSAPGFTSRSSKGRPSKPLPPPKVVRVTPARTRDSTAFAAFRESVESAFDNSDCEDSAVERTLEGVRRRRAVARRRSGMELIRGEVMGGWRDELARIAGPRDEHIALSKVASLDDIISPESLQGRDEEDRRFLELAFVDERKKWNHQLEGAGRYASEERWRREVELNGRDLEARSEYHVRLG
ncbi:hypothetical protein M427DRAFT_208570 [Gonapodya prolifera JEL478]|uniref:Uncharacterized protein n=1 Tax=Gonapodya prolifera (strain JEL478) TaxID=1344416 RepID=A0A139ANN1_GONPJ|nr:hypothetical protein M427DRAFT_208570 [Gonapodya prolifera JEL478]|eukprot:KXS18346.1 hypothetical protein M427DRAFT_208570 [Gonapodya prolifera JEL478]